MVGDPIYFLHIVRQAQSNGAKGCAILDQIADEAIGRLLGEGPTTWGRLPSGPFLSRRRQPERLLADPASPADRPPYKIFLFHGGQLGGVLRPRKRLLAGSEPAAELNPPWVCVFFLRLKKSTGRHSRNFRVPITLAPQSAGWSRHTAVAH